MANFAKINNVAAADIAKVNNVAKADIANVSGMTAPTAAGATTCVIASQDGYFAWSTGSADSWAAATWHFYRTALTTDDANDIDYGLDHAGNPFWMCTIGKTARPTYYSTSSIPSGSGNWTTTFDTVNGSKVAYGVTYGINANAGIANWVVVGDDCRVGEVTNDPPETISNWTLTTRLNTGFGSGAEIRDVAFNNNADNPVFVAVTNNGRIASSPSAAAGSWTVRQSASDTDTALWRVVHGNGVWVACGYYGNMQHMTGSGDGETWGIMGRSDVAAIRLMYGVANDGGNNWVMVGNSGYVWRSSDNAVSWTETRIVNSNGGNSKIYDVAYDGAGTWVACGLASEIWTSADNGANWTNLIDVAGDWSFDAYQNFMAISFNRTA